MGRPIFKLNPGESSVKIALTNIHSVGRVWTFLNQERKSNQVNLWDIPAILHLLLVIHK